MSPFVVEDVRAKIKELGFGEADAVGDLCFIIYREMMDRWNASPRWTTIHYIKKEFVILQRDSDFLNRLAIDLNLAGKIMLPGFFLANGATVKFDRSDVETAASLAFDVFMHFHGIEYEKKKRDENGDIL